MTTTKPRDRFFRCAYRVIVRDGSSLGRSFPKGISRVSRPDLIEQLQRAKGTEDITPAVEAFLEAERARIFEEPRGRRFHVPGQIFLRLPSGELKRVSPGTYEIKPETPPELIRGLEKAKGVSEITDRHDERLDPLAAEIADFLDREAVIAERNMLAARAAKE